VNAQSSYSQVPTGTPTVEVGECDLPYPPDPEADWGCCALDDGHDGVCAWRCSGCGGTGRCPECWGTGGDDDVVLCERCEGGGGCHDGCYEGWVSEA
jgi:hypothetical protein